MVRFLNYRLYLAIIGALVAFLSTFLLLHGWGSSKKDLNIILITLDSARADHLGAYGYDKNTSPNIDRIAAQGVLFKRATNQSSWTNPSIISILTSLYPLVHGVEGRGKVVREELDTPIEVLRRHGYSAPSLSYLSTTPDYANVGFEPVDEKDPISWLKKNKARKFFLWLHFTNPHLPYSPGETYEKQFAPAQVIAAKANPKVVAKVKKDVIILRDDLSFNEADRAVIKALYDAEIREADEEIGNFLKEVRQLGLLDKTLVIITADHGEELFERGGIGHTSTNKSGTLYEELIKVPLILRLPGKLPKGKVLEELVEGLDVMPTVFELAGLPLQPYFQGRSLLPMILGSKKDLKEAVFAETTPCGYQCKDENEPARLRAIRTDKWKLIENSRAGSLKYELYDLASDAAESVNLIEKNFDVSNRLKAELAKWRSRSIELEAAIRSAKVLPIASVEGYTSKVASAISIIKPVEGEVINRLTFGGKIVVQWTGNPEAKYKIQYDIGENEYKLKGYLTVKGNKKEYGPFSATFWRKFQLYNPWKFRVAPLDNEGKWSEWVLFNFQDSGD